MDWCLHTQVISPFIFQTLSFKYLFKSDVLVTTFMLLQELKSDDLIRIDNVDYNTKFFILRAKRLHNGKYTIIAKNSVGEDRVDFDITVLGKYKDIMEKAAINVIHCYYTLSLNYAIINNYNINNQNEGLVECCFISLNINMCVYVCIMLRIFKPCNIVVVMVLSSFSLPCSGTFFHPYECHNKVITNLYVCTVHQ